MNVLTHPSVSAFVFKEEYMSWLILSIAAWGLIHSGMASVSFKESFRRIIGARFAPFYRLFFNIFSLVSIAPILYLMAALPDKNFYQAQPPWSYLMSAGQGLSAFLLLVSLLQTDVLAFAGLRQLFEQERNGSLVTNGVYRLVRHPLYTFGLLIIWLSPQVSINSFIAYLAFTAYILIGIVFEERKLLREFGQAYADYKSVTPMLIPGLSKILR
jgi:protein-S-isoprenylcysteine O-methyltransferase Ste14